MRGSTRHHAHQRIQNPVTAISRGISHSATLYDTEKKPTGNGGSRVLIFSLEFWEHVISYHNIKNYAVSIIKNVKEKEVT